MTPPYAVNRVAAVTIEAAGLEVTHNFDSSVSDDWFSSCFPVTLGTAQLSMPYGKVVRVVPPSEADSHALFDVASAAGINSFDTAQNYRNAEALIGSWLKKRTASKSDGAARPYLVSKVHPFPEMEDADITGYLATRTVQTLNNLGVDRLDGLLVHKAADFVRTGVAAFLMNLKSSGVVRATGVSVYDPDQLVFALAHAPEAVDFVQVPASVFDQRFLQQEIIERCLGDGVAVFARSVFLQGTLFMDPDRLPPFLSDLADPLRDLRNLASESNRSLTALAIAAVLQGTSVTSAVVGVASPDELYAAVDSVARPLPADVAAQARALCSAMPAQVVDPRLWPQPA